ncbi:MAG: DUF1028 domain-containing protein [Bauldia sp.]|nr:DUF1028 domain-containing protein [Bauldia sp.]
MLELNTFSIAAGCRESGMFGVAVSTAMPAVGANCPFVRAGVGAIATQSWVNPYLGIDGLHLLAKGLSADETIARLIANDPRAHLRQLGVVDRQFRSAAYSGEGCTGWYGHLTGDGFAAQGNMLTGPEPVRAMADVFTATAGDLPERLMSALEAGQAAGGDRRGKQSAALLVAASEEYPYVDLRVDEHQEPVKQLRRVFEVAKRQLLPFVRTFPTRRNPAGYDDPDVLAIIGKPPAERPG